jgi:hypothetical protein
MARCALILVAVIAGGQAARAQPAETDALVDPGWADPFFSTYLEQDSAETALTGSAVEFSLPVLGFAAESAPGDLALPLGDRLGAAIEAWPTCAEAEPDVVTIPADPDDAAGLDLGSWFTSTYDFGCLQIVVEGDRNRPDPALAPAPEAALESGAIEISRHDENAGFVLDSEGNTRAAPTALEGPPPGEALISYTRGNLVYGITVSCMRESAAFCASNGALRALVGELSPVAGRPQQ